MNALFSSSSIVAAALLVAGSAHAAVDRSASPPPAAGTNWTAPTPARSTILDMDAYVVERHDVPIVELAMGWNLGSLADPPGKEGMTALCIALVGEGPASLEKSAWEDKKADLGLDLSIGAGREQSRLALRVTKDRLPAAVELASLLLTEPALRAADLERLRNQAKASVMQERGNADSAAGRVLGPIAWGKDHPFGRVITEASLDAITATDCKNVVAQLKPRGATLVAVGDVTAAELQGLFGQRLASWKGKSPARVKVAGPRAAKGTLFLVDVPGAAQSRIIVAFPGPPRVAPDYWSTSLMTQILGSGLSSRIVQNLREKNGYTYGARAGFSYTRTRSLFSVASSVRTDVTGKALREVMNEMKGMSERPVTDEEANRERWGNIRALPGRFATNGSTLGTLGELLFFELPLDTWTRMPAEMQALATADVQKTVAAHLQTAGLTVVVAGDKAKILPELKALADDKTFGDAGLVIVDADGRVAR